MRNFSANASAIIHPTLWRVRAYSLPGLPSPTISFILARIAGWSKKCIRDVRPMSNPERIVVIDDSVNDLQVIRRFLQRKGYVVDAVRSGEEGLEIAKRIPPDIFVVDYRMPGIDGFEVTRRIKSDPQLQ